MLIAKADFCKTNWLEVWYLKNAWTKIMKKNKFVQEKAEDTHLQLFFH